METECITTITIELMKERISQYNIKQKDVCEGICSEGEFADILMGKRNPDKLVLDSLHQRVGIGTIGYECIVSREEYEIIIVLDAIVDMIDVNNIEEAKRLLCRYKIMTQHKNIVYHQLERLLCGLITEEKAIDIYIEALKLTIPDYIGVGSLLERRLSKLELTLHVLITIEICKMQGELEDVAVQIDLFNRSCEIACIDDMAHVLCYYAGALGENLNSHGRLIEAKNVVGKALKILQKVHRTYNVRQLLKACADATDDVIEKRQAYWLYETISEMYAEFAVDRESVAWCIPYASNETYPIDEVVRIRRKAMGLKQIDLAGEICSEKTISNIERGKYDPQPIKKMMILKSLGINYCEYGVIDSLDVEIHKLVNEWEDAVNEYNIEKCNQIREVFVRRLPDSSINRQYLEFKEFANSALENRKNGQYEIIKLISALEITCKVWNKDIEWIYSGIEINILYNIAELMYRQNRSAEGEKIFCKILRFYDDRKLNMRHFIKGYTMVESVYASWCSNMGDYEKGLRLSKSNVDKELLYGGSQQLAFRMYDIGWDMEKGDIGKDMNAESTRYIKYAYALGMLTRKYVAEHIEKKGYNFLQN